MTFGLEQHIIDNIVAVFEANSRIDKAYVFGSRAKGNFRPDSDIDIAVKGLDLSFDDILKLSSAVAEKCLSIKIDLIDYESIKEPDLKDHIDRVGIEFYGRWKKSNLGDFINLKRGYDLPSQNRIAGTIPIFSSSGITDFHHLSMKNGPGVITGRYGTIGKVFYSENPYWPLNTTLYVQDFKGNDPKFVYYFLQSFDFEKYSDKSAVPGINRNEIHKESISFPPVSEQIEIATLLSCLDNKIDLLKRQNNTLEQLSETLFRQWFVEEAENNWAIEKLGEVFDIGIGRTPPRKEQHWFTTNATDIKWASIKDMGSSGVYIEAVSEYLTPQAVEVFSIPIIPKNTVMLSFKMTIGRLAISTEKMVSNEAIAHFKQKDDSSLFPEFLYLFLKTYSWVELGSTSSIVESINSQMIKEIEMVIPNKQKLNDFKYLIKPYFNRIRANQTQISALTQTRNMLLPKLMSGEVRVKF